MRSEQENHDRWLRRQKPSDLERLAKNLAQLTREKDRSGSTIRFDDLLRVPVDNNLDAISRAMKKNPGLTREDAQELVDFFGF